MTLHTAQPLHANSPKKNSRHRAIALLCGAAALLLAGWAGADPPARVARLAYISGAVSFSPAGEDEWVEAGINRPLITGDRLWVDAGARAELQVGSAVFHMGGNTSVTLLNLDNRVAQLQVAQGTLNVRVQRLGAKDVVEIDTPNLAYSIRRPGTYRIDVDPAGNTTTVVTRSGQAEVYGDGASYRVDAGRSYRFSGTDLRNYDYLEAPRADEFDRWSDVRDRRGTNSPSARYVSRDVIGYEDLDEYGSWRRAEGYGNVWVPNRVAAGWSPYQDGHWAWVDPWGWTWVDAAPWGFAVSHYGRWANLGGSWGWVPGPVRAQPVYAPALVAFIGGIGISVALSSGNAGNVGWFPLGPRDVYRPSYPVSRTYFNNVNTSNTTVNNTTITNVYNTRNNTRGSNVTYANQRVAGAVIAVPANAFAQSHSVAKARVQVSQEAIAKAPVTAVATVAPEQTSVHGGAQRGRRPPEDARARPAVAKERPPAAAVPFAARQRALAEQPGKPLDAAALAAVKPAAPVPATVVKVVAPPTQPAVAPPVKPAAAPGARQPPEMQKGTQPPDAAKEQRTDAQKGTQSRDAEKGRRADERKSPQPPEAQKALQPPVTTPQPAVNVPRPLETPKGSPPEVQKGSSSDARRVPQPLDAQKAPQPPVTTPSPAARDPRSPEAQKASPPVSVARPPETPKGPPPDAQKAPQPPVSTPPPAAREPRSPDAQKGTQSSDQEKGRSSDARRGSRPTDAEKGPSPDAPKAPPPAVSAPRPPEAQKAPSPPVNAPRPPEAQKAPPPPVTAPKPPEPPKAPPPPAPPQVAPKPPAPPPPPVSAPPRPPEAPKAPPPPPPPPVAPKPPAPPPPVIAPKPPATPPDAGKAADKRSEKEKKDEEDKNRK